MPIYFISKDKKVRALVAGAELDRARWHFFLRSSSLSLMDKEKFNLLALNAVRRYLPLSVRYRNRCVLTGRSGSVFRHFRLSRIMLKNLASQGFLTGLRKSS